MTIKIYKGYEIDATAEQLDDNTGWSASICIYVHKSNHSNGKVFNVCSGGGADAVPSFLSISIFIVSPKVIPKSVYLIRNSVSVLVAAR